MRKVTLDSGIVVEMNDADADRHEAAVKARQDAAIKASADALAASEKVRKDAEKAAADFKARADALQADMPRLIAERCDLEVNAKGILGDAFKVDGVSDLVIKTAIVAKRNPKLTLDKAEPAFIEALYTAIRADVDSTSDDEQEDVDQNDPKSRKDVPKKSGDKSKNFEGKSTTVEGKKDAADRNVTMRYDQNDASDAGYIDGVGPLPAVRRDDAGFIIHDENFSASLLKNDGTADIGAAASARALYIARNREMGRRPLSGYTDDVTTKADVR